MTIKNTPEMIASYVESLIVGICQFTIKDGRIIPVYINEGFYRMMGYTHPKMDVLMQHLERCIIPEDMPIVWQGIRDIQKDEGAVEFMFRTITLSGKLRWLQVRGNLYSKTEDASNIICMIMDITERKAIETELTKRAQKDSLSGLYNKGATTELIDGALICSDRDNFHALMIIDMDDFKSVNDTLGHTAGDALIKSISVRMTETFRRTDIIGRIGGDEFVIFMKDIKSPTNADLLADKLIREFQKPYKVKEGALKVTCSMGIAIYPYHGTDYQELFDKADKAMYQSKGSGKNSYRIYQDGV